MRSLWLIVKRIQKITISLCDFGDILTYRVDNGEGVMRRFIYLDTDTLNSYVAQIYDGLVQTEEKELQKEKAYAKRDGVTTEGGAEADVKFFGRGIDGKIELVYNHLKETTNDELIKDVQTKILHDNAFDQLMQYLKKNEYLNTNKIGDFIEICDDFYVVDFDYYKKVFGNKKMVDFLKKSDEDQITQQLTMLQDSELIEEGANVNEIKKRYSDAAKEMKKESSKKYDDIKDILDALYELIPYRRVLCIQNHMVVLNDKYVRDNIDMTSFKFGGKIKMLGYITNKITVSNEESDTNAFAQIGNALNQIMIPFFGSEEGLNIVHPIAIYYE